MTSLASCSGKVVGEVDYTCLLRQACGYPCALCVKCALHLNTESLTNAFKAMLGGVAEKEDYQLVIENHVCTVIQLASKLMTSLHRIKITRDFETMSAACNIESELIGGTDLTEQVIASVGMLDAFENWDENQMAASLHRRILDLEEPECTDKDCPVHGKNYN